MLSLWKVRDLGVALGFYREELEVGREAYYSGEGDGTGSQAAGFDGPVEVGSLELMLQGAGLRNAASKGAVFGVDMTFKAPKSVGVLWGIADPEVAQQLGAAHDAAVGAALGYMEPEACRTRRGTGGVIQVRGRGFVAAAFRHASSRAGDPLVHTHVVAGNLTLGPDGKWTALDSRHLYRHAMTGGYLYQAELRREITERLGLEWGPVEKGAADLAGFSRPLIEHFSRRRQEMREHMVEHGGHSAKSAQIAVLQTRRAKQDRALEVSRQDWTARAEEQGLDLEAVERILERGKLHMHLGREPDESPDVDSVIEEELTRTRSTFGRPELIQALAAAQPAGAAVADLERLADRVLIDREIIVLPPGRAPAGLTEPRFTTRQMLAIEHDLLAYAADSRDDQRAVVSRGDVEEALESRTLSPEQQQVVGRLCQDGDGVAVLRDRKSVV